MSSAIQARNAQPASAERQDGAVRRAAAARPKSSAVSPHLSLSNAAPGRSIHKPSCARGSTLRRTTGTGVRMFCSERAPLPVPGLAPPTRSTTMASWSIAANTWRHATARCCAPASPRTWRPGRPKATARRRWRCASTRAQKDGVTLDGLSFIVMLHSPGAMGEGNITVGLIIDERAHRAQVEAITAIATGAAGGPMAALAPLVGQIAGVERRPIQFEIEGPEPQRARRRTGGSGLRGPAQRGRLPARRSAWTTRRTR